MKKISSHKKTTKKKLKIINVNNELRKVDICDIKSADKKMDKNKIKIDFYLSLVGIFKNIKDAKDKLKCIVK